ncbi:MULTISPECIES: hypothetical protein [Arthrobacter]|uniref:Uncharacterized protein n=2 Tax=Arthrobacter TaxID=1663 RepID=A0ABU9KLM9_9MICC|nr:hypothetical protein [Arthrobacter sp. YJM1]MDP5228423.1 hypothetical protein [Arthrobacter sp. YJM1]
MTTPPDRTPNAKLPWNWRWPWILCLLALAVFNLYVQSFGHGVCIDYVDRPGTCITTFGLGSPGNEILWAVSGLLAIALLAGLARAWRLHGTR